jgi:glycosyltransferase involved in cell wall biosynthesis
VSSVGVVIPCYRYGHLLHDSVGSALAQQGVDVRVLIIDDASGDGSADVARDIAATDSRVEVIEHKVNAGHIATYNEGLLDWCDADYASLLSADDVLTPGALRRAAELLDQYPSTGFAYGRSLRFTDSASLPHARTESKGWRIYDGQEWLAKRFRDGNGCVTSPEVVVRTSLQKEIGGYRADLPHTGDIEMWMRFAAHADVGYLRGVDQAYYRIHGGNMSHDVYTVDAGLGDLEQRRAAYEVLLEECRNRIAGSGELELKLRRKLAREALYRAARAYDKSTTAIVPVEKLVAFAEETYPRSHDLLAYHTLELRRRVGERRMAYLRPLVLSPVVRRIQQWLWWRSWKRRGI